MRTTILSVWAIVVATGCGTETVNGQLIDGMTGQPVAGTPEADSPLKLVLKATEPVSVTCQAFEAVIQADGTFTVPGACTGQTAYNVALNDKSWWPADSAGLAMGPVGTDAWKLKVWRAPAGTGVYKMTAGNIELLKTSADVKKDKILGTDKVIRSPGTIPPSPVVFTETDYLVIAGPNEVKNTEFQPLIPSGERHFGDPADPKVVQPWHYIGVRFNSHEEHEMVAAEIDKTKTLLKEKGDRAVLYVPGDALPAGRYALLKPKDRRTYIVDFGKSPSEKGDNVADAGKAGKAGKAGEAGKAGKAGK